MATNYHLKNSPLDPNRIKKICKDLMSEAKDDRHLALEAHQYFREMVAENPQDTV